MLLKQQLLPLGSGKKIAETKTKKETMAVRTNEVQYNFYGWAVIAIKIRAAIMIPIVIKSRKNTPRIPRCLTVASSAIQAGTTVEIIEDGIPIIKRMTKR